VLAACSEQPYRHYATAVEWLRAKLSRPAADSLRAMLSPVDGALNAELFRGSGARVPRTTIVTFERASSDSTRGPRSGSKIDSA